MMRSIPFDYDSYKNRHEHIFMGWEVSFIMDGKRWEMRLGTKRQTKMDATLYVQSRYPNATNIRCGKIICEV